MGTREAAIVQPLHFIPVVDDRHDAHVPEGKPARKPASVRLLDFHPLPRLGAVFQHVGEERLLPDGAQFFPDGSVFHDKPYSMDRQKNLRQYGTWLI